MDELNATIVRRIETAPGLIIIEVKPDLPIKNYEPGQYLALGLPGSHPRPADSPPEKEAARPEKMIKRSYSLASTPDRLESFEFYIAIVPEGQLTSRLALLKEGDRIYAAPKVVGTFTVGEVPPNANLVLVATGTGLAPFVSMVRTARIWAPDRKITLVHGVRYPGDFAYVEELQALTKVRPEFSFHQVVSRPNEKWHGERGYVQGLFERGIVSVDAKRDHVFICGNPAMVDDMTKFLAARDYKEHSRRDPGNLHLEKYW